ncbi:hypothetical protein V6N13_070374 [Hibiscus sabdariffa]
MSSEYPDMHQAVRRRMMFGSTECICTWFARNRHQPCLQDGCDEEGNRAHGEHDSNGKCSTFRVFNKFMARSYMNQGSMREF